MKTRIRSLVTSIHIQTLVVHTWSSKGPSSGQFNGHQLIGDSIMEQIKHYCTYEGCPFNDGSSGRFFKRKQFLDQHVANCHSERKFICEACSKSFAMNWQLKHHLKSCGINWTCLSCAKCYKERLSLITHCKRHQHQLPENAKLRNNKKKTPTICVNIFVLPNMATEKTCQPNERLILPKTSITSDKHSFATTQDRVPKTKDAAVQTDRNVRSTKKISGTQTDKSHGKQRASKGAQCTRSSNKRRKRHPEECESIETQTNESILYQNHLKLLTQFSPLKKRKISVETNTEIALQTELNNISSAFIHSNNPLLSQLNEVPYPKPNQGNTITEQSVQTDDTDLLAFTVFNTIETQTSDDYVYDGFDPNDNDALFRDVMELNDIETQTKWNNDETTQTEDWNEKMEAIHQTVHIF